MKGKWRITRMPDYEADYPDMMFEILRSLAQRLTRTTSELTEARAQIKGVS